MVGAYKARVAIFLEEQPIDVVSGVVEREPRAAADAFDGALRSGSVDVDLTGRTGL